MRNCLFSSYQIQYLSIFDYIIYFSQTDWFNTFTVILDQSKSFVVISTRYKKPIKTFISLKQITFCFTAFENSFNIFPLLMQLRITMIKSRSNLTFNFNWNPFKFNFMALKIRTVQSPSSSRVLDYISICMAIEIV